MTQHPLSRLLRLGALAVSSALLAACGSSSSPDADDATRAVTDGVGAVTIPASPQRVIAADSSTYAQLVSLGVTVVGAALPEGVPTEYYLPDGVNVPNVVAEDGWTVDLEKALDLDPDLIVTLAEDWNTENVERYKASPIPAYALDEGWEDIDDIYTKYRKFAADLGRSDAAEDTISAFEQKLTDGKATLAPHTAELGAVGIVRTTSDGWVGVRVDDPITTTILPGLGIATPDWPPADSDAYLKLSVETLEQLNIADTLFVETDGGPGEEMPIVQSDTWKTLTPAKNGKVIVFTSKWWNSDLLLLGSVVDEFVDVVAKAG